MSGAEPVVKDESPLLTAIIEMIDRETDDPGRAESLADLSRIYLRRLAADDVRSPEALYGELVSLYEFICHRTEPFAVRVVNPTVATHGYDTHGTVIELNIADGPFLLDSITNEIVAHGLAVSRVHHPVIGVERNPDGSLTRVRNPRFTTERESIQHYELDRRLFDADLAGLERALSRVLGDVSRAVRDFHPMLGKIDRMIDLVRIAAAHFPESEVNERIAFLSWLRDDNFVLLGYREYRVFETPDGPAVQVVPGSGLGVLADDSESNVSTPKLLRDMPDDLAERYRKGDLVVITKTNRVSTVHRRSKMDYIGVRILGPDGRTTGEARLVGLFTSKAYMEPAGRTPVLRRKLADIVAAEDLIEGSHDHKLMVQLFEGYSKHDLFALPTEDLRRDLVGLLALQEQHKLRLFVRRDLLERSVSILVALPRDRFNPTIRQQMQDLFLERFGGISIDYHLTIGETESAMIHFTVWVENGSVPDVPFDELEAVVLRLTRSWRDQILEEMQRTMSEEVATTLADRWCGVFPDYYQDSTPLQIALGDVRRLDDLASSDRVFVVGIQNEADPGQGEEALTRVTLYRRDGKRPLTELVPALENLGLEVVEEVPTRLVYAEDFFIHDFGVRTAGGDRVDIDVCGDRIRNTLEAVWAGDTVSDSLHRLVVTAGLDHRQIEILRAYVVYWRRVMPVFTIAYVNDTLCSYPDITAKLARLFEIRFDPAGDGDGYGGLFEEIQLDLDDVPSLDQDRIFRSFLRLIDATMRTNAYKPDRVALAFKLRSEDVPDVPAPIPMAEIFVTGRSVEGVHLRGGPVARGGIRWSTRREDYRTEVLGLMKAQMTKNAVIVPTGAKGGFVVLSPPDGAAELREEVRIQYEVFIRSLLDVTDNLVEGEVVHPEHVRIHDGDDPYLVVAADKGTAAFSDLANSIAGEYGFWLGDAFASGGSAGYDHKALGITARGAWVSLERHLWEMKIDPARDPFTVIGIGDMSGDVFGNGMLASDRIRLIAAFDHRHIFLDPDPDPDTSFAERKRLFELPGSSWADYDADLISQGGGVFNRSAKRISLSQEARRALGTEQEQFAPSELIRIILTAPVEVLWNGGIGTYVKASEETNEQVGDRVNDPLRVDGCELRCKAVVEGGNLGLTQKGRIEFARQGGKVNTDFIDNSGGVDCSDREVNLKILLSLAVERGELSPSDRDHQVAAVADNVVEKILYDNFQQAQMISQEETASVRGLDAYEDLMQELERVGILDRLLEALPASEELAERGRNGHGLTRPELAVLLADSKRYLKDAISASTLPDDPYVMHDLRRYFPSAVVDRFGDLLVDHPLRRQLASMLLANDVVNAAGCTFVTRLCAQTGADPDEVVRAYRVSRDTVRADRQWEAIEGIFGLVELDTWNLLMTRADDLVATLTRWFLSRLGEEVDTGELVDAYAAGFAEIERVMGDCGPAEVRAQWDQKVAEMVDLGVPEAVASWWVHLPVLLHGPDTIELAARFDRPIEDVLGVMIRVGQSLSLDTLDAAVRDGFGKTPWQRWALQTLDDDLSAARRDVTAAILADAEGLDPEAAVDRFMVKKARVIARVVRFMRAFVTEGTDDLAPMIVGLRQVRSLIG